MQYLEIGVSVGKNVFARSIGSTGSRPRIAMNGVRLVPGIGALRIANSMNLTYFAQSRTEAPDSFTMLRSVYTTPNPLYSELRARTLRPKTEKQLKRILFVCRTA